jgi:hypothetical protein
VLYLIAGTDDLVADGGIGLPQLAARIYDGPRGLAMG